MVDLGVLPGAAESIATAVSGDGLTVVGNSARPFRWRAGEGMVQLDNSGVANAASWDGSVIVGASGGGHACYWLDGEIHVLQTELLAHGVTAANWNAVFGATGVSSDGRTLVGAGIRLPMPNQPTEAWIATIDVPSTCYPDCDESGKLNVNDYICFQTRFALGGGGYPDCDGNGLLNVNDYICFQTRFALGC